MSRHATGLMLLSLLWLTGCTSTQKPAPVRDTNLVSRPLPPAPAGFHRIQRGDTLYKIAFQYGLDFRDLAAWNQLADPGVIQSGKLLRLAPPIQRRAPVSTAAMPATADVLTRAMPVPTPQKTAEKTPSISEAAVPEQLETWIWPSQGPLLTRFGQAASKGIDIGGSRGHPVRAANAGTVVYAGTNLRGYGKLIIIRHGKSHLSAYAHNERMLVAEGQSVMRGQSIAEMGDTDADRIKLHFEIREHGKPVDPLNYLPKQS